MEKVLVIGSSGFLGKNVSEYLAAHSQFEIHRTSRHKVSSENDHYLDLRVPSSIDRVMNDVQPDMIVNCAGIIGQTDDIELNSLLTSNLLTSISCARHIVKRVIISGSAAEYGYVEATEIPVKEDVPLRAAQGYGLSKIKEERESLRLRDDYNLPVVVARIFNPIGVGMDEKFLVSSILRQLKEVRSGTKRAVEISRLDSQRDYIAVDDVSRAFFAILSGDPKQSVYNIGSGKSTSNAEMVELFIDCLGIKDRPELIETSGIVEQSVAYQANIERMKIDFGWTPRLSLRSVVERIVETENDK